MLGWAVRGAGRGRCNLGRLEPRPGPNHTGEVSKLVFGVVAFLTGLLMIEQALLRWRPWWLARGALIPIARRPLSLSDEARGRLRLPSDSSTYRSDGAALDPARLEWPAPFEQGSVEITPPSATRVGWARVRNASGRGFTGVVRIAVVREQDTLVVRLDYHPATLAWALGMVGVLVALILSLAPWHVGLVVSAIVLVFWLAPSRSAFIAARARLMPALEQLAERLERAPEPARPSSSPRRRR